MEFQVVSLFALFVEALNAKRGSKFGFFEAWEKRKWRMNLFVVIIWQMKAGKHFSHMKIHAGYFGMPLSLSILKLTAKE